MSEIILFTPRREVEASENLKGFIAVCRDQLTMFGAELEYSALVWNVTAANIRGGKKHCAHTLTFCTHASAGRRRLPLSMQEPFCSFAKGYIRYQQAMRPVIGIDARLAALRVLEAVLTENGGDANPARIDTGILNRAAQFCKEYYSADAAVSMANMIKQIATFMSENRLLHVRTTWRHGLKGTALGVRVGKDADERRAALMPSQRALDGLASIFNLAEASGDVLVSATAAILSSAPDRISELLALPMDCEVSQKKASGEGDAYGLRWWPAKGAEPMVKWIIPSMSGVVKEAVRRIRTVTEDARSLAKWYEVNPTKLFLPPNLEHLRHQTMLTMQDLGMLLYGGRCDISSPGVWAKGKKIETFRNMSAKSRPTSVKFADVEKAVIEMLPSGFPFIDVRSRLRYSDALYLVLRNALTDKKATMQCMIEPVTYSHIQIRLGNMDGAISIFEKFNIIENDGKPARINTHQFRHYLNTLAKRGGLSEIDIAKWSGRRDVRQNASYDHVSGHELVAQMRAMVGDSNRMIGPISTVANLTLIPRDEFARLKIPTAHTTELGYCIHDFTMSPCKIHRDCISCGELVCLKGDASKTDRIRKLRDETATLLELARKAQSSQEAGASRWMVHQEAAMQRLDQLCAIFDNPLVPDGAFIQQAQSKSGTRLELAAQERAARLGIDTLPSTMTVLLPAPQVATAQVAKGKKK